jgi:hypothetical protein
MGHVVTSFQQDCCSAQSSASGVWLAGGNNLLQGGIRLLDDVTPPLLVDGVYVLLGYT